MFVSGGWFVLGCCVVYGYVGDVCCVIGWVWFGDLFVFGFVVGSVVCLVCLTCGVSG